MVKINYRHNGIILLLDGVVVSTGYFVIDDYQKHSVVALPLHDSEELLPLCGSVQANALNILSCSPNFDTIYIKRGEYELLPNFVHCPKFCSPKVLLQNASDDILVTVYSDGQYRLLIEDQSNFINHTTTSNITSIDYAQVAQGKLIIARGDDYVAIVLRDEQDYYLIFERHGSACTLSQQGIELEYRFNDTRRRIVRESYVYTGSEYLLTNRNFEYRYKRKYPEELLPILLIDAIMADDIEDMTALLSAKLGQNLDAIKSFFGKILCYYNPDNQTLDNGNLILLVEEQSSKVAKTFHFLTQDYRIVDINCKSEE